MKSGRNRIKTGLWILLLLFLCTLSSCKSTDHADAGIRIRLEEYSTGNGTSVQIPEFYAENEQLQQSIHELERETKKLRRICEKAKKNNEHLEMQSYIRDTDGFPQVTVVWYTAEEDSRTYNLVTLCADEKEGIPITCREALVRTGMRGVDLSLQVGKLAQEADLGGELSSMEMQGFQIDETGIVREIYMKLLIRKEEGKEPVEEEHFFTFIPEEDRIMPLSEKGFDVP